MIRRICAALALAGAGLGAQMAPAAACEVALSLALDVSASVDAQEYRQQLEGVSTALTSPAVRKAVLAQPGGVALSAYEWSGPRQQQRIADWTRIETEADIDAFAGRLARHPRGYSEFPTAVGYALSYGALLMRKAPPCRRQVIDVSGDGVNNEGFPPASAYRAFDFSAITVNGLVVGAPDSETFQFYISELIRGPDAFVETAADYSDFARAMRRKLLRELSGAMIAEAAR